MLRIERVGREIAFAPLSRVSHHVNAGYEVQGIDQARQTGRVLMRRLIVLTAFAAVFLAVTASAYSKAHEAIQLPFREVPVNGQLDSGWSVDLSEDNFIASSEIAQLAYETPFDREGSIVISARANTYAHIERPLNRNLFRASCAIVPGEGISWTTSLFVYWDVNNWRQIGVLRESGGIFYITEMTEGCFEENRFPGASNEAWNWVAIEVLKDGIQYLVSSDGTNWSPLHVSFRGKSLLKPPSLLIVGKGFGREFEQVSYPNPDLDNDYADRGEKTLSFVKDISVAALERGLVRLTREQKAGVWGRDTMGDEELLAQGDPTFDSVSRHFPPMQFPRESLGVKDHPDEFVVLPDGSLKIDGTLHGDRGILFFEIGPPFKRVDFSGGSRFLTDGYLPIHFTLSEDGDMVQGILPWSEAMSPDLPLRALVYLSGTLGEDASAEVRLRLQKPDEIETVFTKTFYRNESDSSFKLYLDVPFGHSGGEIAESDSEEFSRRTSDLYGFWEPLLNEGMQLTVPENRINDAYRTWLAFNFINVDKRNDLFEPHDGGGGFYGLIYAYSAALYCVALDMYGFSQEAEVYLESLLNFVSPEGLLSLNFGVADTGALLYAITEHTRLTGSTALLERSLPTFRKMCDWIIDKREQVMASQSSKSPLYGIIKFRPYCDYPDPAYCYLIDTYLWLGLKSAADAFAMLGFKEDAERIAVERDAYAGDILKSMTRSSIRRDGMRIVPMFPETHELLKSVGYTSRDYYTLVAGVVLETGLLPASDKRGKWIMDFLEERGGLLLRTCTFRGGIDHAYTYGYWMNCLEQDDVEPAILGLYSSLAYGMTRDTYSAVECTQIRTGANDLTLPHLYSNTQQLRLLRNMMVREEGSNLLIGQAIPRHWLQNGQEVVVEKAPTFFGEVSFRMHSDVANAKIVTEIDSPKRNPPTRIRLHLRHPTQQPIHSVTVNGQRVRRRGRESVDVPVTGEKILVEAHYR